MSKLTAVEHCKCFAIQEVGVIVLHSVYEKLLLQYTRRHWGHFSFPMKLHFLLEALKDKGIERLDNQKMITPCPFSL